MVSRKKNLAILSDLSFNAISSRKEISLMLRPYTTCWLKEPLLCLGSRAYVHTANNNYDNKIA